MIPENGSSVFASKSAITSTLNDYRYSTHSSSYRSPTYLTSNSPIIRSYSSKNANLFDNTKSYKNDMLKSSSIRNYDDFSSSYHSRPVITDKYLSNNYDKRKLMQVSPSSTVSKYQTLNYRSSSSPSNTYLSKTIDSKILDGNANYHIDSSFTLPERKLSSSLRSSSSSRDLGLKKYLNDSTNNLNDKKQDGTTDERKDYRRKYDKLTSVTTHPEPDTFTKWAGLRNIGNTCYMNSILQCLSCTKLLKEYVSSRSYIKDINQDGKLIGAFGNLINKIWTLTSSPADVSAFKDVFQRLAPQFAGYEQHDAQEFLRFLVDKLHVDVNRVHHKPKHVPEINDKLPANLLASEHWKRYLVSENSYILDLFAGQLKSTLQCLVCKNESVTFEIFWDVSLPLPTYSSYNSNVSISDILNNFTQEEILDGREKPTCSKCKVEQRMAKSYSFQKLPKYLVLHLKRFQTTSSYRKLSTVVQFPLAELDMSPFLAKSVINSPSKYNLYAVSNHVGTPFTGHYTANCKHPSCADWYTCNDSSVSKITPPVQPKVVSADSYILFYEAVD